jgi:hypothetical protein
MRETKVEILFQHLRLEGRNVHYMYMVLHAYIFHVL